MLCLAPMWRLLGDTIGLFSDEAARDREEDRGEDWGVGREEGRA